MRGKGSSRTFVLIHGAWHGGWCWGRVARMLRDVGHTVHTPTLTGLGDRAHLAHRDIDLALHVRDVLAFFEAEELRGAVLVGHGYGGMVVSGVAAAAANRLAHLVYLDAFVPARGQSVFDLLPSDIAERARKAAAEEGEGWRVPSPPPERFGVTHPKDAEWLSRHLTPQPLRTFEQALESVDAAKGKRTYLYCGKPAAGTFDRFKGLEADRAWRFREIATGHDAMVTAAGELATILLGCE